MSPINFSDLTPEQIERRLNRLYGLVQIAVIGIFGIIFLMVILSTKIVAKYIKAELFIEHVDSILWVWAAIILAWMTGEMASAAGAFGKKK